MKKLWVILVSASICAGLGGCHPAPAPAQSDDSTTLRAAGYAAAPEVTGVTQAAPGMIAVEGLALPDSRVRFQYGRETPLRIGVTADSKGRFLAELPASPQGSVFDLFAMDDAGRLVHAEGRLFVPPDQPGKAVMMRPGMPSLPVYSQTSGLAVVDYDSAGAFAVAGRVAPRSSVNLTVGDVHVQRTSDAQGYFNAVMQIPQPTEQVMPLNLQVEAGGAIWKRDIGVSRATGESDQVTPLPQGWRIDWKVPGGGLQTTLVF
ncbi:MAG TPA: hypothetical protein VG839_04865 [Asticcacaulis sp.]|nr:hypothetical protein [Asticcacaulis sp.]